MISCGNSGWNLQLFKTNELNIIFRKDKIKCDDRLKSGRLKNNMVWAVAGFLWHFYLVYT
jgi:hypothetical protein